MREARNSRIVRPVGMLTFLLIVWFLAFLLSLPIRGETPNADAVARAQARAAASAKRADVLKTNLAQWDQWTSEQRDERGKRFLEYLRLPNTARSEALKRYQHWKDLPETTKQTVRDHVAEWNRLPEAERAARRQALAGVAQAPR